MPAQAVALIGAGNLRTAHHVICALARYNLPDGCDIRLYDASPEPLDLYDRFARACVDLTEGDHLIRTTSDLREAMKGATAVIVCPDEDCARRMVQPSEGYESHALDLDDDPRTVEELRRGDMNLPTPTENLSEQHMAILQKPRGDAMTGEEAIHKALLSIQSHLSAGTAVLDLMLDASLDSLPGLEKLNWPPELSESDRSVRPHEVLRCCNGNPLLSDWMAEAETGPIARWLASLP